MNFNQITLIGRLTANPEKTQTNNGKELVRFTVAVNRNYKDDQGETPVDFIPCVAFGKTGEFAEQYGSKGRLVLVQGRLDTRRVEKDLGHESFKYTTFSVVVNDFRFLDPKNDNRNKKEEDPLPF